MSGSKFSYYTGDPLSLCVPHDIWKPLGSSWQMYLSIPTLLPNQGNALVVTFIRRFGFGERFHLAAAHDADRKDRTSGLTILRLKFHQTPERLRRERKEITVHACAGWLGLPPILRHLMPKVTVGAKYPWKYLILSSESPRFIKSRLCDSRPGSPPDPVSQNIL